MKLIKDLFTTDGYLKKYVHFQFPPIKDYIFKLDFIFLERYMIEILLQIDKHKEYSIIKE